jgi:threonine/homoserine/homoserine lactone efflux protein
MPVPMGNLLAFALAAFILIIIPGPSVLFVVSRALAYGRRTALLTVLGGALGSFVSAVAIAIGVGVLIQAWSMAYTVLKFLGAGYLIYLGIRAIRHRKQLWEAMEQQTAPVSGRRTVVEGFLVSVTNPKSMVFFVAVLPQFVAPAAGAVSLQMIIFGAIFALIALASDTIWGLVAGAVRGWFARSRRRLELIGGASGLTMIGLGAGVALNGRKD